jgi:hypothetical protein
MVERGLGDQGRPVLISLVGRSPWTAADALVGPLFNALEEPDQGSGAGGGARPTFYFGGGSPRETKSRSSSGCSKTRP